MAALTGTKRGSRVKAASVDEAYKSAPPRNRPKAMLATAAVVNMTSVRRLGSTSLPKWSTERTCPVKSIDATSVAASPSHGTGGSLVNVSAARADGLGSDKTMIPTSAIVTDYQVLAPTLRRRMKYCAKGVHTTPIH